ncbi:YopJ/AvrA family T3SS effector serine/threonine acetyltransferase [Bartonella sp. CB74]|uniref:YopJ/AvrA family T3SS effector serine/threonine acetyltransferase n=1 Tax=Bartonella sp. CB74 TaxID=3113620 RepID=UPI002F9611AB
MKPRDSRAVASSSSQMQESDAANEPLAGARADLEKNISSEEDTEFSPEELKSVIANLEKDIADGRWVDTNYARIDLRMMPALVEQANEKYPDVNLRLANNPHHLAFLMEKAIDYKVQSSRFIVSSRDRGIHFAVIDYRALDEQNSFILFEPTTFHGVQQDMLRMRTLMAVKSRGLPNCHFSMVEMDIQRSSSECGIFSLALAKKLYTESERLRKMHEDNVRDILCEPDTPLPSHKLDQYLPVTFYKHTQGKGRLEKYIESNPSAVGEKVNKKDETVFERYDKNLVATKEEKAVSVSSHKKRIREYKSVLTL